MFGETKRYTKIYKDNPTIREKTLRFLIDNGETFVDYPENKEYMIEREDLQMFNYLNGPFETRMSRVGAGISAGIAAGFYFVFGKSIKLKVFWPVVFAPIPMSLVYCNFKLGEFLDYCAIKYRDKGLNDEDLLEYHRENSKSRFMPNS